MITTDAYGRAINERTYSGAATRKMLLVAQAMRSVGLRTIVVSIPFVGSRARRFWFSSVVSSEGRVPIVFTATLRSAVLRKFVGPVFPLIFFMRHARRGDTVIFYNYAYEYLLSQLVLRLRGVKLVQDIEDAPIAQERGFRGFLNRLVFPVTFRLTAARKMVVANHVAEGLGLDDFVTIRGVAAQEINQVASAKNAKWAELKSGGELKLHYGGTLITETGVDLFCEAVDQLAHDVGRLACPVNFKITGIGNFHKIRALQERVQQVRDIKVEVFQELDKSDYLRLLDSCHGSFSLKRPGSDMSNTTFPSKVIEITGAGLALVSGRLGDVAEIFVNDSAFFLDTYIAEELVEMVITMAADPVRVEKVAAAGCSLCNEVFSLNAVGLEMLRLI